MKLLNSTINWRKTILMLRTQWYGFFLGVALFVRGAMLAS